MRRWLLIFGLIGAVLVIDQATKQWILQNVPLGASRQPIPALAAFFELTHSLNTGAAFGFLPQAGEVFLVIALIVVFAMLVFYPRLPSNATLTRVGMGLICGGALGNALDRLQYGHVIDFIHYQLPGVISNVSNLADHAIVIGVLLVLVDSWRLDRQAKPRPDTPTPPPSSSTTITQDIETRL